MKLFRFMSAVEYFKLIKGETLVSSTDHRKNRGSASTAKGFCFGIGDEEQAKKDFRRLKGIVNDYALVVFTLKPESESRFNTCQGRYIDYDQINSEGKTIHDYPLGMEPHCMVVEYCASSYSLKDFEEYKVYGTSVDINKDPSDKEFFELQEPDNPFEKITDDLDLNKGRKVAMAIIELFQNQNITSKQALIALGISTSIVFDFVVIHTGKTHYDCIDAFVDILKTSVYPEGENK